MKRYCLSSSLLLTTVIVLFGCQTTTKQDEPLYAIAYSFKGDNGRHIYFADANGKSAKQITMLNKTEGYPAVSPDGKKVAFYGKYDNNKTWSIHVANVDGSAVKRLTKRERVWDSIPSWSPDSQYIAFAREYKNKQGVWQNEIWLTAADSSSLHQIKSLKGLGPKLLANNKILFFTQGETSDICIANRDGSNVIKLTNNSSENWYPDISPDGSKIVFMSNRDGNREIYSMNIDGSNQQRLTFNEVDDWNPSWSADGKEIIFSSEVPDKFFDVYKMNHDGSSLKKLVSSASQASWIKSKLPQSKLKSTTTLQQGHQ